MLVNRRVLLGLVLRVAVVTVLLPLVLQMLVLAGTRRLAAGCHRRVWPSNRLHVSAAGAKVLFDLYPPNLIGGG